MLICPSCGTGFQDDEEFCLDCGLKLAADDGFAADGPAPGADGSAAAERTARPNGAGTSPTVPPTAAATEGQSGGSQAARNQAARNPAASNSAASNSAARNPASRSSAGRSQTAKGRASDAASAPVLTPKGGRPTGRSVVAPGSVTPPAGGPQASRSSEVPTGGSAAQPKGGLRPLQTRPLRTRQPDPTTDRQMRYRPVYKAPDEWTAVTIKELLRSAGLSAQVLSVAEPFDDGIDRLIEGYWGKVLVLESDLDDACRLIGDYLRGLDRSMH